MSTSDRPKHNSKRVGMFIRMYQRAYERGQRDAIAWFPVKEMPPPTTLEWVLAAVKERAPGSPVIRCYTRRAMTKTVLMWLANPRLQRTEYLAWTAIPKMPDYLRAQFRYEFDNPYIGGNDGQ